MANTEERLRRTMMFVPGNNPAMIKDAGIYGADSIMFDFGRCVYARKGCGIAISIQRFQDTVDYGDAELVVRINGLDTPYFENDIKA
ncbi:MAG: aldolase/citrate lyase family protein [Weissella confusa]